MVRASVDKRDIRPDIQGLRAIAVVLVVLYHLYPSALPGGYVGVDVFFVISGFLITGHLLRNLQRDGRVGLVDFYGRRARRLMPASALVLAVTWIASRLILPVTQLPDTASQIRASALYFQNWVLAHNAVSYLKSDNAPSPVQHFWSLSVEEQFYLLWPLLFLVAGLIATNAARRRPLRAHEAPGAARALAARQTMFVLAAIVAVASLAWSVRDTATNPAAAYFVTTTRIWELGAGGLLALINRKMARRIGRVGILAWAGLAMVIVSALALKSTTDFPGSVALLPVGGAVLMIAAGSDDAKLGPSRFTSLAPVVFLGDISYSLYLWHWPIIVLWKAHSGHSIGAISGPAIAATAILLAWLTKILVEDPIRLAVFFRGHSWWSVGTVTAAVVPVLLVSIYIAGEPGTVHDRPDANHPGAAVLAGDAKDPKPAALLPPLASAINDVSITANSRCQTAPNQSTVLHCVFGDTTHPTERVALIGDSFAGQWSTALMQIADREHWRLDTFTHSGCPWTATLLQQTDSVTNYADCVTWGRSVLRQLITTNKPNVVITSDRPTEGVVGDPLPNQRSFVSIAAGMVTYWRQLIDHGINVVAIKETPQMIRYIPDCIADGGNIDQTCGRPASSAIYKSPPLVLAARTLGSAVSLIDMNSLICEPTECLPVIGNVIVFRDSHHLTNTYTLTLEPYLQRALLATHRFGSAR